MEEVNSKEKLLQTLDLKEKVAIVVTSSWGKGCADLLSAIEQCKKLAQTAGLCFISLALDDDADDNDMTEELVLALNDRFPSLSRTVPSVHAFCCGKLVQSFSNFDVKAPGVQSLLDRVSDSLSGGNCCRSVAGKGCCGPTPSSSSETPVSEKDRAEQLRFVSESYSSTATGQSSCCVSVDSTLMGYSAEDILKAGSANLGVGCGNPLSFATLQPGEHVLDLGSGAGIDCFLAADKVGPLGRVTGVDMSPDMLHKARQAALERQLDRVSFRLGEIEHLPVADGEVDVVLSNCVINLSPDKAQVFREIYRALRCGGRIAISDVILRDQELPNELKTQEALAC